MAYRVELVPAAQRDLSPLPESVLLRVKARFVALSEDPRPAGTKKLKGESGYFRVRVGDYRIIYDVDDGRRLVTIARVLHRREAYRRR